MPGKWIHFISQFLYSSNSNSEYNELLVLHRYLILFMDFICYLFSGLSTCLSHYINIAHGTTMHSTSHKSTGHPAVIELSTTRHLQTRYPSLTKLVAYTLLYPYLHFNTNYQVNSKSKSSSFSWIPISKIQALLKILLELPLHIPWGYVNTTTGMRTTPPTI